MQAPLHGIKVLDCSMGVAGPHSGMLCAQHGADVIKIESIAGDWSRLLGKPFGDLSVYSTVFNRGKRSLAVDLKAQEGRDLVAKLAAGADVVIEAFRPGVMKKLGLDFESVRAANPGVVYLSVTGFGQTGPRSGDPANDSVVQAFSGFMHANRDADGNPQRLDMIVMDIVTGLYAFQAISMALMAKFRGNAEARHIDCSLMQCATALQTAKIAEFKLTGGKQPMYYPLGVFPTKDGFINISTMHEHLYVRLCEAMERPDLATDPRFRTRELRAQHKDDLMPVVLATLKERTTSQWQERLTRAEVLHAPVRTYDEVVQDEQLKLLDAIAWVEQDGMPGAFPIANIPGAPPASLDRARQSPHVGEHTVQILAESGIEPERIRRWLDQGIVRSWSPAAPPAPVPAKVADDPTHVAG